jgi:hypothetical protein
VPYRELFQGKYLNRTVLLVIYGVFLPLGYYGFQYSAGRTASIFGPFIVSFLFSTYGYGSVFVYIALCWVIVALLIGLFGPLTTRRSLEQLNVSVTESGSTSLEGKVTM